MPPATLAVAVLAGAALALQAGGPNIGRSAVASANSVQGPAQASPANVRLRPETVKAEFLHAWRAYRQYAWGRDELRPLSRQPHDWYAEPLLITQVDSLDSLVLLALDKEARETREYIAAHLSFDRDVSVKVFEIVIRMLGGLLSGHQLTGDPRLLGLAEDLGRRLLPAFESKTGIPYRPRCSTTAR